ncbi:hypothetical protein B0H14DRAFT_2901377 [Mycena olivaceomarginata]|nr:hypothetical protein B0H14DRAFT_2901377 [Mycena olivaceomarginata]
MGTRGYRSSFSFLPILGFIRISTEFIGTKDIITLEAHSFVQGLGVQVAAEVPRDPEAYKEWLERLRKSLDADFEENKSQVDSLDYFITKEQPLGDVFIEWVYEIDLDHEVFLVDSNPLFALNNMPPSSELFVKWIGVDSYEHRSYDRSTPKEHVYDWKAVPPQVDDSIIDDYTARQPSPQSYSLSEVLAVRIALYEAVVGRMMLVWEIGHHIRHLEAISDPADISGDLLLIGIDLVQVTVGRMFFGNSDKKVKYAMSYKGLAFSWLAADICLRITTHLDDERHLKKSILELVDEVSLNRQPGIVTYGILFSFFHCVIVRVDLNNEFKSTTALQFLPSFYATSSFTPGIAAIGSLAHRCLDIATKPAHFLHQVPLDVLELITGHLSLSDLHHLCAASPMFAPAAESLLRFPHIEDYRLIEVSEAGGKKTGGKKSKAGSSLTSQTFSTMVQSSLGPLLVVGDSGTNSFGVSVGNSGVKQVRWRKEDRPV